MAYLCCLCIRVTASLAPSQFPSLPPQQQMWMDGSPQRRRHHEARPGAHYHASHASRAADYLPLFPYSLPPRRNTLHRHACRSVSSSHHVSTEPSSSEDGDYRSQLIKSQHFIHPSIFLLSMCTASSSLLCISVLSTKE